MSKVLPTMSVMLLIAVASTAWAHHSGPMFEPTKSIEFDGTVKEFQWTNPHSWLQKVVFHPMRDGSHGGRLVTVTLADGHVYNGQGGAPAEVAGAQQSTQ